YNKIVRTSSSRGSSARFIDHLQVILPCLRVACRLRPHDRCRADRSGSLPSDLGSRQASPPRAGIAPLVDQGDGPPAAPPAGWTRTTERRAECASADL